MIPTHWLGYHRAEDDEILGYLVPTEEGLFTPVTVFGYPLGSPATRAIAERRLDAVGMAYLADRWTLEVAGHPEPISVEVVEADPEALIVKNVDYGSTLDYGHRFILQVPVTHGLRHG